MSQGAKRHWTPHSGSPVQVSAVKQSIAELRAGLRKAEAEINVARGMAGSSSSAGLMGDFGKTMSAFHESATASLKSTEVGQISIAEQAPALW